MKQIICFFLGHKIISFKGKNQYIDRIYRKCERCNIHFGIPDMENPPPPPPPIKSYYPEPGDITLAELEWKMKKFRAERKDW